jgi:hypothetical protein
MLYLIITYRQGSARTAECQCPLTSYNLWVVGDAPHLNLSSFFQSTLIINTDVPCRVEVDNERYSDSKAVCHYGTQYIIAVQQCIEVFAGYHRFVCNSLIIIMFSYN